MGIDPGKPMNNERKKEKQDNHTHTHLAAKHRRRQ